MDSNVAHGIDWLVAGNHRFKVGLHQGRPCAAVVTSERLVCIDLAGSKAIIDEAASEGQEFLDIEIAADYVIALVRNGGTIELTYFLHRRRQTASLFPAPFVVMFPGALSIGPERTCVVVNTADGPWFAAASRRGAGLGPWSAPTLRMEEIGEWLCPSLIDLVTSPESGTFCGLAYAGVPSTVAGGPMEVPEDEGWFSAIRAVTPSWELSQERSMVRLEDIRCALIRSRPALAYGTDGAVEFRDLATGELMSAKVVAGESGRPRRVYSVDVLGEHLALLLDDCIEIRHLYRFDVLDRIELVPQEPKKVPDRDPALYPSRHAVRLLETDDGLAVAWIDDREVHSTTLSRPVGAAAVTHWTSGPAADSIFGDAGRWTRTIPLLWQMFALPLESLRPPRRPRAEERWQSEAAFDYWNPLLHLVIGPLGWADPGLGAQRWLEAGRPVECGATRVLDAWWGEDVRALSVWQDSRGVPGRAAAEIENALGIEPRTAWEEPHSSIKAGQESWVPLLEGGTDPLHLGGHAVAQLIGRGGYDAESNSYGDRRIAFDHDTGRGAIGLAAYVGWYRSLHETGADLESRWGHGMAIDVVVRPVGWLGSYQRSKATNRWYACSHDMHLLGFPGSEREAGR